MRASGTPPYWEPGEVVCWHYRRRDWKPGDPEAVQPTRVVRDDDQALVAWLAGGTPVLAPTLTNGAHVRTAPLAEMFRAPRVQGRMLWKGEGTLRIAPTGRRWSVWLFWDAGRFDGWYVNLESPHRRAGSHLSTVDHVLDVLVAPDRTWRLKDQHELAAAVTQGRFTAEEADAIRRDAEQAVASLAAQEFPFRPHDEVWQAWRPDPAWGIPDLPAELAGPPAPDPRRQPRTLGPGESRY